MEMTASERLLRGDATPAREAVERMSPLYERRRAERSLAFSRRLREAAKVLRSEAGDAPLSEELREELCDIVATTPSSPDHLHTYCLHVLELIVRPSAEKRESLAELLEQQALLDEGNLLAHSIPGSLSHIERRLGIDERQLAQICDVTLGTVRSWAKGRSEPRYHYRLIRDLVLLAQQLDIAGLSPEQAKKWFNTEHPELGMTPREWVASLRWIDDVHRLAKQAKTELNAPDEV